MGSTGVRRDILDAALECFVREGYEATTIARIRERSGASNGALFHHFRSKEAIADALYLEALSSFQGGLWELIVSRSSAEPRSLRAIVRETIAHQLRWTEQHPDEARFVYTHGHLDWDSPARSELAARNRELAFAFRNLFAPLIDEGEVRASSMLVATAIVAGPAHAIARRWLAGQLERSPIDYLDELADAAWAGLRREPNPAPASASETRRARVTFELLDERGGVAARGAASTELVPLDSDALGLQALVPADV